MTLIITEIHNKYTNTQIHKYVNTNSQPGNESMAPRYRAIFKTRFFHGANLLVPVLGQLYNTILCCLDNTIP